MRFRGSHTGRGGVIEIGEATLTVQPEGQAISEMEVTIRCVLAVGGWPLEVARGHLQSECVIGRCVARLQSKSTERYDATVPERGRDDFYGRSYSHTPTDGRTLEHDGATGTRVVAASAYSVGNRASTFDKPHRAKSLVPARTRPRANRDQ